MVTLRRVAASVARRMARETARRPWRPGGVDVDADAVVLPAGTKHAASDPAHLLAALLDRAVRLQPDAERVIRACARPGDPPIGVARDGGSLVSQYSVLHQEVADLPADGPTADLRRRAGELIMYHLELLNASLELALPVRRSPILEAQRRALKGLGPPAEELRILRDRVQQQLQRQQGPVTAVTGSEVEDRSRRGGGEVVG